MGNERHQGRSSVSSIPEAQLIGTILDDDIATPLIAMPRPQAPISQPYNRSTSAPPQLSLDGSSMVFVNGEVISPEDPRLSPAYYAYYYSQRPIDPRLPPPLLDYSSWSSSAHPQPDAFKHMRLPMMNTPKRPGVINPKGSAWAMEKSFGASMIQQDFPRTPSPLFPAGWMASSQKPDPTSTPFNVSSFDIQLYRSASADIEQLHVNMNNLHVRSKPVTIPYNPQPYYPEPRDFATYPVRVDDVATGHVHPQPIRQYWPNPNATDDHVDSKNASSKQNGQSRNNFKNKKASADTESSTKASILHELRTNKHHHHIRLSDVINQGLVAILATDQNGSRFIQMQLEQATKSQLQEMYEQLEQDTIRLSVDVFANYVIQKFFENGTQSQRRGLAERMLGAILPLSMQMYGCRVVQKALEVIELDQQLKFAMELRGHIDKCVKDQNGNHVVQKCIEVLPHDAITLITNAFVGNVCSFSMHAYGCRVIQRLLEHCKEPRRQEQILQEIMSRISSLIVDQFGNYVIQNIIERGPPAYRDAIINEVKGHICDFSRHKFASNVVEKCFAFGSEEEKETLVRETCGELPSSGCEPSQCPLVLMVKDPFGNYVVQKILCVVNADQRNRLVDAMRMRIPNLRKIAFGKHIVATVARLTGIVM